MPTCIWCLTENAIPAIEHVIPDALGCPENFVLTGGIVCKSCNNGLSHLDRAVVDEFDIFAFMANVPRKGGRRPVIKSRGNLVATRGSNGPEMSINMDPRTRVAHDGGQLGAFGKSRRNVDATLAREGTLGTVSFTTTIGEDPKFVRGITKIAFGSFVFFMGSEAARSDQFGPVRAFVREGVGQRPLLMMPAGSPAYKSEAWPPYISKDETYSIAFRLAAAVFLVDLSPTLSSNARLKQELSNEANSTTNWAWIPPEGPNDLPLKGPQPPQ